MRTFLADLAAICAAKGHEWSLCPCCDVKCVRCGYRNLEE